MKTVRLFITLIIFVPAGLHLIAQQRLDIPVSINGMELIMPWNGGFNAPQFSNLDLNRDGVQDMISFDRQGDMLRTYLRLPASGRWILDWQYTSSFPELVDWVFVADFDKDGVEDLFTSSSKTGVAGIKVYKGIYQDDVWSFEPLTDRGKEYLQVPAGNSLTNLFTLWDDIPAISDVDGDGDLDVLVFDPGGSFISYYKNHSVEMGWGTDSLRFDLEDSCWGKILENELSETVYLSDDPDLCSDGNIMEAEPIRPRHVGSTIMALDVDFDGDKDAIVGDISSRKLIFLHNGLSPEEAWITEQDDHFPSQDTVVDLPYFVATYSVELDDDPEPELLAAINSRSLAEDRASVWRYDDDIADGPLNYKLGEKGFFQHEMIDLGSHSRPAIADINGDGLNDMVVGGYTFSEGSVTRIPSLWLFENQGTLTLPYFVRITDDYLSMSQYGAPPIFDFDFAPAFGDLDADGTTDLIIGDQNGKLFFFKNISPHGDSMSFEPVIYPYMDISVGVSATPQISDINGDGLGDLLIGERTGNSDNNGRCSNLTYFENVGSPGAALFLPDATAAPNTQCFGRVLFDIQVGLPQYSIPAVFRTKEGLKLMMGNARGTLLVYDELPEGKTGPINLVDDNFGSLDMGNRSAPAVADINGDGFFDLIVGNQRGGLELFSTTFEVGTTSTADPVKTIEKPYHLFGNIGNGVVDVTWKEGAAGEVFIFDLIGCQLECKKMNRGALTRIDISNFATGSYLILIQIGDKRWAEKVVKVR